MKPRLLWVLLLLGSSLAVACLPQRAAPPVVEGIPFRVELTYTTAIPSPYYVLSGPFQSYARFPFNEDFRRRLETYVAAKSAPQATQTLELKVHAVSLATSYDRIGTRPQRSGPQLLAQMGPLGRQDWPLSVFDQRSDGPFDDLPERITKTATLQVQATLVLPGLKTHRAEFSGRSAHILERQDMGLRTYDYDQLITEVQADAIRQLDETLDRILRNNRQP